ncbi:MAG: WD40 repeat domain-containing protein, partial [Terriglobales bacterium]
PTPAPPQFERVTFQQSTLGPARFLPDGQSVISTELRGSSAASPFSARLDSPGLQPLNQNFARVLAVSAAGVAVLQHPATITAYEVAGTLALMPLGGGAPRPLLDMIEDATWAPGAASASGDPLAKLAIVRFDPKGRATTLEYPPGKVLYRTVGWLSTPRFSADGKLIAAFEHPTPGDDKGGVVVLDESGGVKLHGAQFNSAQGLAWSPGGNEVWFTASKNTSQRSLYDLSLSGRQRQLLSSPESLFLDDVLPDGRALIASEQERILAMLVTPDHPDPRDIAILDWANRSELSRNGRQILVGDEDADPRYATFLEDASGSAPVRLGPGDPNDLSSDGQWALSMVPGGAESARQLWLLPTGAGAARQLTHGDMIWSAARFVAGRNLIVALGNAPGRARRTYLIAWNGAVQPLTPEGVLGILSTPDGKNILAMDRDRLFTYPVGGGPAAAVPAHLNPGQSPVGFGPDSSTLYVQDTTAGNVARVTRVNLGSGAQQPMFQISMRDRPAGPLRISGISADGKTYIYTYASTVSTLYVVTGLH